MLDDRKLAVLRAIVEDYVSTNEPVGSKALVERHGLAVSSATVRNDMAALEEEGYITQPHTSAGRVPTDLGYRLFVDRLAGVKPLTPAERRAIVTFLEGAADLDDIVARTVRLLAQLTRQVAVVQYPSLTRATVRHVEVVPVATGRVMIVLITDTGRVEQRVVDAVTDLDETVAGTLRARFNAELAGRRTAEVAAALDTMADGFEPPLRPTVKAALGALVEMLASESEERVVVAGAANLTRYGADLAASLQPVLDALEEQVVLMRLLGEATDPVAHPEAVMVRIGHENPYAGLAGTSVVTTAYGEEAVARLGVLGPTRMDYPGTIGAVRAVARYVGRILAEGQ